MWWHRKLKPLLKKPDVITIDKSEQKSQENCNHKMFLVKKPHPVLGMSIFRLCKYCDYKTEH